MSFGEYCVVGTKEEHIEALQGSLGYYMNAMHKNQAEWIDFTEKLNKELLAIEKELAKRAEDEKLLKAAAKIAAIREELKEIRKRYTPRRRRRTQRAKNTKAH